MSCPVTSFFVKPSRCEWPIAKPTAAFLPSGPDASPLTSYALKLPNGTTADPVHLDKDGRTLVMLTRPPSVLRPNSALCGPRTNSTCDTSSSSMLDELVFSCGTPSM